MCINKAFELGTPSRNFKKGKSILKKIFDDFDWSMLEMKIKEFYFILCFLIAILYLKYGHTILSCGLGKLVMEPLN